MHRVTWMSEEKHYCSMNFNEKYLADEFHRFLLEKELKASVYLLYGHRVICQSR